MDDGWTDGRTDAQPSSHSASRETSEHLDGEEEEEEEEGADNENNNDNDDEAMRCAGGFDTRQSRKKAGKTSRSIDRSVPPFFRLFVRFFLFFSFLFFFFFAFFGSLCVFIFCWFFPFKILYLLFVSHRYHRRQPEGAVRASSEPGEGACLW